MKHSKNHPDDDSQNLDPENRMSKQEETNKTLPADQDAVVESLLDWAGGQVVDADPKFLERLQKQTAAGFQEAVSNESNPGSLAQALQLDAESSHHEKSAANSSSTETETTPKRGFKMLPFVTSVLAASLFGLAAWLGWSHFTVEPARLGAALDRTAITAQQSTLRLSFVSGKQEQGIWAADNKIKVQLTPTQFELGTPESTWLVDESKQAAALQAPRYFAGGQLSLLNVFAHLMKHSLAASQIDLLRALEPVRTELIDDVEYSVYETQIETTSGRCGFTGWVNTETGLVHELTFRRPEVALGRPTARLRFLEYGGMIDEKLFALSPDLKPQGEVAQVKRSEGNVSIRPVLHRRWTYAGVGLLLQTGDQVRVGGRGANAVEIGLENGTATVGPGSLLELVDEQTVKLRYGTVELKPRKKQQLYLTTSSQNLKSSPPETPEDSNAVTETKETISKATIYRRQKPVAGGLGELVKVAKAPKWLSGFKGKKHDPTGSLVATIDGRNVPLNVGYHHVNVDIRDQIARTVIEQSFVNNTRNRLEGVFYFPLPQDASISGFGMWINGELVEADVVERQRAREIYETILREKRDPGLLEWDGGNIFKARVFPIEGNSEKRIKITYTQVLPQRNNRYLYQYGLQSEMLRQNPLRELDIKVTVSSATPLVDVLVPTHETQIEKSAEAASIQFSAEDYTPTSDFELAVQVAQDAPPVTVVPHQRGDDGYLLVQLNPPSNSTLPSGWGREWDRNLLDENGPLELLIVADTSASMNGLARAGQADFVEALIGSLGSDDRINVAVTDVNTIWKSERSFAGGEASATDVRQWLEDRHSLGWSNLDKMLDEVLPLATAGTQVIYIGDGVPATYNADPFAFAARLRSRTLEPGVRFHAVSVGSSFEPTTLKAMANLGGGTVRHISANDTPAKVANDLLMSTVTPGLTDIEVSFSGIQVAAAYPDSLPNLPLGMQQVLLARYLPQMIEADGQKPRFQEGEVVVRAMQGDQPLTWSAPIKLREADRGNAFVPRLWARKHLDHLLAEGSGPEIKQQVIGLSEEFHIITPYTSLLVLESDEDRERFGVKRRYKMRGGEQFFAQGRADANFELLQQQMKSAGTWRVGLQRRLLSSFMNQGRFVVEPYDAGRPYGYYGYKSTSQIQSWRRIESQSLSNNEVFKRLEGDQQKIVYLMDGDLDFGKIDKQNLGIRASEISEVELYTNRPFGNGRSTPYFESVREHANYNALGPNISSPVRYIPNLYDADLVYKQAKSNFYLNRDGQQASFAGFGGIDGDVEVWITDGSFNSTSYKRESRTGGGGQGVQGVQSLLPLFPNFTDRFVQSELKSLVWSEEVRELLMGYEEQQKQAIEKWKDLPDRNTLSLEVTQTDLEHHSQTIANQSRRQFVWNSKQWFHRSLGASDSSPLAVQWQNGKNEFVLMPRIGLGQKREVQVAEIEARKTALPALLAQHLMPPVAGYVNWKAKLEKGDAGRVVIFTSEKQFARIQFEVERGVPIKFETGTFELGKYNVQSSSTYANYQRVGDLWLPGLVESFDAKGRKTSGSEIAATLETEEFVQQWIEQNDVSEEAIVLEQLSPRQSAEKRLIPHPQALQNGTVQDHLLWIEYFVHAQRSDRLDLHLAALKKLVKGKRGADFIELYVLNQTRRREEARLLNHQLIKSLEKQALAAVDLKQGDNGFHWELYDVLATLRRLRQYNSGLQYQESYELWRAGEQIYELHPLKEVGQNEWQSRLAQYLSSLATSEATDIYRQLAERRSYDSYSQTQYTDHLASYHSLTDAIEWLEKVIEKGPLPNSGNGATWDDQELKTLRGTLWQHLENDNQLETLIERIEEQIADVDSTWGTKYLSLLAKVGQQEKQEQLIREWLQEVDQIPTQAEREAGAKPFSDKRIIAAINQISPPYTNQTIEERWVQPLAELVRKAAQDPATFAIARRLLDHHKFAEHDEYQELTRKIGDQLLQELDTRPDEFLLLTLHYLEYAKLLQTNQEEQADWKGLVIEPLKQRWLNEKDPKKYRRIAHYLTSFINQHQGKTLHSEFLRERVERAQQVHAKVETDLANSKEASKLKQRELKSQEKIRLSELLGVRNLLFNALVSRSWTAEIEKETWELVRQLSLPDATQPNLDVQNSMRWAEAMINARIKHHKAQIKTPEQLTAQERTSLDKEASQNARKAIAEFLLARSNDPDVAETLRPWLKLEGLYWQSLGRPTTGKVRQQLWTLLGQDPLPASYGQPDVLKLANEQQADPKGQIELRATVLRQLEFKLQRRVLVSLQYHLSQVKTKPKERQRLLKFIREGQSLDSLADKEFWRMAEYEFELVLGNIKPLIKQLEKWSQEEQTGYGWKQTRGILAAEAGDVKLAIKLFEEIEAESLLAASDYLQLADWYLVQDKREEHDRAKREYYSTVPFDPLQVLVQNSIYSLSESSELDPKLLLMLETLSKRTINPENNTYLVRLAYDRTKDFRILRSLPSALIGQSARGVYPELSTWQQLISQLMEEAASDSIKEQVDKLRPECRTVVDQRALDLLIATVEARASELRNGGEVHLEASLASLRSAMAQEWSVGERELMAKYLSSWKKVDQPEMMRFHLDAFRKLHQGALQEPDWLRAQARLKIAGHWASSHRRQGEEQQAIDVLSVGLNEFVKERKLSNLEARFVSEVVDNMESLKQFGAGERFVKRMLKHCSGDTRVVQQLNDRLNQLYIKSVKADGKTSLGAGLKQYEGVMERLQMQLAKASNDDRKALLINVLSKLFYNAWTRRRGQNPSVAIADRALADFQKFSEKGFFEIGFRDELQMAYAIYKISTKWEMMDDHKRALIFLLDSIERNPALTTLYNKGYASSVFSQVHRQRSILGSLGKQLEQRTLVVLCDLLEEKLSRLENDLNFFRIKNSGAWKAKKQDYLRVAKRVWAEHPNSSAHTTMISNYVGYGLEMQSEAILMLETSFRKKDLTDNGVSLLIDFLTENGNHARAIELLRGRLATKKFEKTFQDHHRLIKNLAKSDQKAELLKAIEVANELFNIPKFHEGNLAQLAAVCSEHQASWKYAVSCYKRLIERRRQNNPQVDTKLAEYYRKVSANHEKLGSLKQALDTANAAIVVVGSDQTHREKALQRMTDLVNAVAKGEKPLNSSLKKLTNRVLKEENKTGLFNYLIHKAIGQAHLERSELEPAIERLTFAIELQPNDREIHEALIQCYDQSKQPDKAIAQRLDLIRLFPREVQAYEDLSQRFRKSDQSAEAERAVTSLPEMLPQETEGHAGLAKIREQQNNFEESLRHWSRVADLREKEPTGLLGRCQVEIKMKDFPAAESTLDTLRKTDWPERFEIKKEIKKLEQLMQ